MSRIRLIQNHGAIRPAKSGPEREFARWVKEQQKEGKIDGNCRCRECGLRVSSIHHFEGQHHHIRAATIRKQNQERLHDLVA